MAAIPNERRACLGDVLAGRRAATARDNPVLGHMTRVCTLCGVPRHVSGGVFLDHPRVKARRFVCAAHHLLVGVWQEIRR